MDFTHGVDPRTGQPTFKVGRRRVDDDGMALVWVLNKRGKLRASLRFVDGCWNALVSLETGDTIFVVRDTLMVKFAVAYHLEVQSVRRLAEGKVIGPNSSTWVPREIIPNSVLHAIGIWVEGIVPPGKLFVEADSNFTPIGVPDRKLVYSTEKIQREKEKEDAPPIPTREAIFGKKRRSV